MEETMRKTHIAAGALALSTAVSGLTTTAGAQDGVAEFYKGKTVTITVGHQAGTGFDLYSRVLIRYMDKHIPGTPNMIVNNMVGASGVIAANWLYNSAPRDGTAMGIFVYTVPLETVYGNPQARFDPAEFNWIGNIERASALCGVSRASGIRNFEDLRQSEKEVVFGGSGATGPLVTTVHAMKNLLGANVRVISGYKGAVDVKAAILRGELQGVCSQYWSFVNTVWKDEFASGDFIPVLQHSGERLAELPDITHTNDLAKTDEERQLFNLVFNVAEMARNYAMPPGVPAERVSAMRKAFMDTMADPGFVAEAKKMNIELKPVPGEEVGEFWRKVAQTPQEIVEKAKKALQSP